jgi:hypothetical protein
MLGEKLEYQDKAQLSRNGIKAAYAFIHYH